MTPSSIDEDMETPYRADQTATYEENKEQMVINEEYKMWKKNSVSLYDTMYCRALTWPSLTTQWFPDIKHIGDTNLWEHRLLLGTNTNGTEQNYVFIDAIQIPRIWQEEANADQYNEDMKEVGGFGVAKQPFGYRTVQKINHPSEVNKARYMWGNPNIIATLAGGPGQGRVLIFDRTKHETSPKDDEVKPEVELEGHSQEGWAMSWNWKIEGNLVTGAEDGTVKAWDCRGDFSKERRVVTPIHTWLHHTAKVNDVQHHPRHAFWIGTVSDDKSFQVIDTRKKGSNNVSFNVQNAHSDALNCIAFHPQHHPIVATGGSDKIVAIWDLRWTKDKTHILDHHKDAIIKLEWMPQWSQMIASSSADRRINIWNIARAGQEQSPDEADDGPPELLFQHGGFTNSVNDFSWNKHDPWVMVAAAEDNQLQVFRPARALVEALPDSVLNRSPVFSHISSPEKTAVSNRGGSGNSASNNGVATTTTAASATGAMSRQLRELGDYNARGNLEDPLPVSLTDGRVVRPRNPSARGPL